MSETVYNRPLDFRLGGIQYTVLPDPVLAVYKGPLESFSKIV